MIKFNFYRGYKSKKDLLNSYYIHPTLKYQPYGEHGFELVLWFWKWYISVRITKHLS